MKILRWLSTMRRRPPNRSDSLVGDSESDAAAESEIDPFNPFSEPVQLELTDVFDLHSIPPRDVERAVVEYLSEAHSVGFRSVRIIHGKGIGVQRELVHRILLRSDFVLSFSDAPPDAGGWGATVVHLSPIEV
jgi:dsDNA-specific endonuclease/ATPase MutS2